VLVWLEGIGCFVCFRILAGTGSPVATTELAASVVDHDNVFYVAAWQEQLYDLMLTTMRFAIPGIMLTGFSLHYIVGVKILTDRSGVLFTKTSVSSPTWIDSRRFRNRYLEHFRELRSERTSLFTRSEDSKVLRRYIHQLSTSDF